MRAKRRLDVFTVLFVPVTHFLLGLHSVTWGRTSFLGIYANVKKKKKNGLAWIWDIFMFLI